LNKRGGNHIPTRPGPSRSRKSDSLVGWACKPAITVRTSAFRNCFRIGQLPHIPHTASQLIDARAQANNPAKRPCPHPSPRPVSPISRLLLSSSITWPSFATGSCYLACKLTGRYPLSLPIPWNTLKCPEIPVWSSTHNSIT